MVCGYCIYVLVCMYIHVHACVDVKSMVADEAHESPGPMASMKAFASVSWLTFFKEEPP